MPRSFYHLLILLVCLLGFGRQRAQAQPETIAVGIGHTLAIHANGTLWACGYNADGRLGDGTTTDRLQPVQIGSGTTWRTVSIGGPPAPLYAYFMLDNSFTLALKADGSLWSWGTGALGGANSAISPQLVSAGPWVCAAAGRDHAAAVRADGTLWTWGNNVLGELGDGTSVAHSLPAQVGTATNWASVSAGEYYTLALKTDGTLWAWGIADNLGVQVSTANAAYVPVQVGTGTNWARICAGNFSLATRTDGTLWIWGKTQGYDFNSSYPPTIATPRQVGTDTNWSRVASGESHILITKTDGTLWSWGYNRLGQLGIGSRTNFIAPVQVGSATAWRRVAAGGFTSAADQANGTLWLWGNGQAGQNGDPTLTLGRLSVPVQVGTAANWATPGATDVTSMAVRTDGSLWTWGGDRNYQLGDGPLENRQTVARIDSPATYRGVSGSDSNVLALRADSSLWGWGYNSSAQVGDGTTAQRPAPVAVAAGPWKQLSTTLSYSMGLRANGTIWGWGENTYGQLGDGSTTLRTRPVQVGSSPDWQQVVCFDGTTLALRTDGSLWGWGRRDGFGTGSTGTQLTPVRIGTLATWAQLAASTGHVLALRTDGSIWAWGSNTVGQLGDGTTSFRATPVRVGTATDWASVTTGPLSGNGFSMALKRNGTLWTWGINDFGQLGYPTTPYYTPITVPTQVGSATWAAVAAGSVHAVGVRTDGTLWAWGNNREGQLGKPSFSLRPASVQTGMRPFTAFSLAGFSPTAGMAGTTVTLTGVGLDAAQLVTFGGVAATSLSANAAGTVLTVAVPAGARSGLVAVLGPDATVWSTTAFQVLGPPVISSFAPSAAAPGATITVTGTNLAGATSVLVGGVSITSFVVNAAGTSLTFAVPAGSSGGFITVNTAIGTVTSGVALRIVLGVSTANFLPSISVAPQPAPVGRPLALFGLPVGPFSIELLNVLGQRLATASGTASGTNDMTLGPAPTHQGVYILSITTAGRVTTRRVIVE